MFALGKISWVEDNLGWNGTSCRSWNNDYCCFLDWTAEGSTSGLVAVAATAGVVVSVADWIKLAGEVWLPICLVDCFEIELG
jgi:hypothetical protein